VKLTIEWGRLKGKKGASLRHSRSGKEEKTKKLGGVWGGGGGFCFSKKNPRLPLRIITSKGLRGKGVRKDVCPSYSGKSAKSPRIAACAYYRISKQIGNLNIETVTHKRGGSHVRASMFRNKGGGKDIRKMKGK